MKAAKKPAMPVVEVADKDDDQERKWRAEDALRTLTDAEKVRSDPKLMADVEKARKERMRQLESIKVEVAPMTMKKRGK